MKPELNAYVTRLGEFISRHGHAGITPVSSERRSPFRHLPATHQPSGAESNAETDSHWSLHASASAEREFNVLALELFALQFALNPAYKTICKARGAKPGSVEHWTLIPAVPTSAFKELELTCLAVDERTAVFHSSGTTSQRPSRHFHCPESIALYEASLWPWFQRNVVARSAMECRQLIILTPPPDVAPHSSLVHMFDTVRRRFGANIEAFFGEVGAGGGWMLDLPSLQKVIRTAADAGEPVLLLGTAFNLVHCLDHLAGQSIRYALPTGSVVMETGGYKGQSRVIPKTGLHRLITDLLGVPASHIICEYGMSELSSQAYDGVPSADAGTFHFPPWARVQIISPESGREAAVGETGLVRVFDLANAFSVLAVHTGDLAIRHADGFELLGRAASAEPRGCSLMATSTRKS